MDTNRDSIPTVRVVPVVETIAADLLTPLAVYLALSKGNGNSFLFESVEGGASLARYSFIGSEPFEVNRGGAAAFDAIRDHLGKHKFELEPGLPPFAGGVVGFLGFEACGWFEPALKLDRDPDDLCAFMLYRSIAAFDHAKQVIKLISLAFIHSDENEEKEMSEAKQRNQAMRERISRPIEVPVEETSSSHEVQSDWNRTGFESAVSRVKEYIAAGECYQVVLSQRFRRRTSASAVAIYRALRSLNPSPYMFLISLGGRSIIGSSPETLIRCQDGTLEYRPIAGTRVRGTTPAEDEQLANEMSADAKETAEHMMLVDLGRNDLGRVCEYGSVTVRSLKHVEKYSHVQHLVSSLSGKLRGGLDRFDALGACFPAGTVSGAPKVRAIEVLRELEPVRRGIYAGAVGYFDYAGNMDTCIAIRTIELTDGVATIQAGAGIVADSVPAMEFDETINKAKVLLRAIELAEEARS